MEVSWYSRMKISKEPEAKVAKGKFHCWRPAKSLGFLDKEPLGPSYERQETGGNVYISSSTHMIKNESEADLKAKPSLEHKVNNTIDSWGKKSSAE